MDKYRNDGLYQSLLFGEAFEYRFFKFLFQLFDPQHTFARMSEHPLPEQLLQLKGVRFPLVVDAGYMVADAFNGVHAVEVKIDMPMRGSDPFCKIEGHTAVRIAVNIRSFFCIS
jgi:hypothetical protein